MKIIIDAMGGDNAPDEIVKGAAAASDLYRDVTVVLVGDENRIKDAADVYNLNLSRIEVYHTDSYITMDDHPTAVVREKKDSSMALGLKMLRDGADAFISAGNTGALHAGSTLIVRKIPGIQRSGIATILPFARPLMLMDSGANPTVTAEYLEQWALMCSVYMHNVFKIDSPAVGLLNNGTEQQKGTPVIVEAYERLTHAPVNFVGNVESRELPFGPCDVIVTDGFTGNIVLKLVEGMGKFMFGVLKEMYTKNAATKVSYLVMKDNLKALKNSFDASEYGGAPFLGLTKPVIKAHGSADARAITNSVKQAISYAGSGVADEIASKMASLKASREQDNTNCENTAEQ